MNNEPEVLDQEDDDPKIDVLRRRERAMSQKYAESGVTVGELESLYIMVSSLQAHLRDKVATGRRYALTNRTLFDATVESVSDIWQAVYGKDFTP